MNKLIGLLRSIGGDYFNVPANALANRNIGQETTAKTTAKAINSGK
jgi:hypothetical protein